MKNKFILLGLLMGLNFLLFSQISNGSYAKNFIMNDIYGNTHSLYKHTNALKPVAIDFFATWCNPCWNYHNAHAFKTAYETWEPNAANEMMLFAVEGNRGTIADIQSPSRDWSAGTPYPILYTSDPNSDQIIDDYNVTAFPSAYIVCPNRRIYKLYLDADPNYIKNKMAQFCTPPDVPLNAVAYSYDSPENIICQPFMPKVTIQNLGTSNLISAKIICKIDDQIVAEHPWTGNLSPFEFAQVTILAINTSTFSAGDHVFKYEIVEPNGGTDEALDDNAQSVNILISNNPLDLEVIIHTDLYPGEISWEIKEHGPYKIIANIDYYSQQNNNHTICAEQACYNFKITDLSANGMSIGNIGHALVVRGNDTLVQIMGDEFTSSKTVSFCVSTTTSFDHNDIFEQSFSFFPNPITNNEIFINFIAPSNNQLLIDLYDVTGKKLRSIDKGTFEQGNHQINLSGLDLTQGVYIMKVNFGTYNATRKLIVQ